MYLLENFAAVLTLVACAAVLKSSSATPRYAHSTTTGNQGGNSLETVVSQLADSLQELQAKFAALQNSVSSSGSGTSSPQGSSSAVAFSAQSSTDQVTVSAATGILQFDTVTLNIGNGFNTNTGMFTTAYSGTYVFLLNLMALHKKKEQVSIQVDGKQIAMALSDSEHVRVGNSYAVTHLSAGQQVCVRHFSGDKLINGTDFTIFSGFLLQVD